MDTNNENDLKTQVEEAFQIAKDKIEKEAELHREQIARKAFIANNTNQPMSNSRFFEEHGRDRFPIERSVRKGISRIKSTIANRGRISNEFKKFAVLNHIHILTSKLEEEKDSCRTRDDKINFIQKYNKETGLTTTQNSLKLKALGRKNRKGKRGKKASAKGKKRSGNRSSRKRRGSKKK